MASLVSDISTNEKDNKKVHASTDDNCSTLEEKEGEVDGWITWERMRNYQKEGSSITITKRNFKQRAKGGNLKNIEDNNMEEKNVVTNTNDSKGSSSARINNWVEYQDGGSNSDSNSINTSIPHSV